MTGARTERRARIVGERGIAALELAIVLPVLLLLALGTAEMGMAWVSSNRVEGATSTAARIGASSGSLVEADRNILLSLRSSLPPDELANVDRVVIYKPDSADGAVPANCIKPPGDTSEIGVTAKCNTYTGATVRSITSTTDLGSADDWWVPSSRKDTLAGPPDDIGVWVRTTHRNITHSWWGDFTIKRASIYRIQPDIGG